MNDTVRSKTGFGLGGYIYRIVLILAGWVLFALRDPTTIIWLLGVTLLGYGVGTMLESTSERRLALGLGAGAIVFLLVFFKYGDLVTGRAFVIPLGLSYYSLMVIGYLVDVYRGDIAAEKNIVIFALYVGFFPQTTAGPIGRAGKLLDRYRGRISVSVHDIKVAFFMIILGVFEKWVLADNLKTVVDGIMAGEHGGLSVIVGFFIYSLVIYHDFAGYSLIAIGLARLFGIRFEDNYHAPYLSGSIREFWRRWHISLSSWFRDYLYIPLGGSRCSSWRRDLNTLIIFILSGAWHGSAIGFWIWGALHGLYLVIENHMRPLAKALGKRCGAFLKIAGHTISRLIVFVLVSLAWVPFYAGDVCKTFRLYGRMLESSDGFAADLLNGFGMRRETWLGVGAGLLVFFIISIVSERMEYRFYEWMGEHGICIWIIGIVFYTLLFMVGAYGQAYDASNFIYGGF